MHIATLTVTGALASLKSSLDGLSPGEASRRSEEFGPNRVEAVPGTPLALRLLREFTHLFAIVLWVAAALAFGAEYAEPGQGMSQLGYAIVCVIVINGLFSFLQEYKAERALIALRQLLPHQAKVRRAGIVVQTGVESLVPGDVIVLDAGDNVPADCRLIESFGMRVNNSTLTGEALPKPRRAEVTEDAPPLAARNLVLAGTSIVSGQGSALVYATGMRTEFGRIAHLTQTARESPSPLQREITHLSRLVALLSLALGIIFFFIGWQAGLPLWDGFMFAIGIIVANVPEGLLPEVTLALAMGAQRMARRNALVRHLPAVETLGSTTVICSDKTGTLTCNRMTVKRLFANARASEADDWQDGLARPAGNLRLLQAAFSCNDVKRSEGHGVAALLGDPMEVALLEFALGCGIDHDGGKRVGEIPFDSDRRRMSVVYESGGARSLYCKGALESLLQVCGTIALDGAVASLDETHRARLLRAEQEMAESGLRVLAFAYTELAAGGEGSEEELTLCGLAGLQDPPRAEVPDAIARCRSAGIKAIMVTGDHPQTALAIARQIGLVRGDDPLVLHGEALRSMTPAHLQLALDAPEIVFARVSAEQKMLVVQALQRKGEVVAVTGDGVNDAPALKTADIGIAMGIAGTDVAKEAADMILLDDNFASIVNAVEEGRAVFENIRKFLTYILSSNVPELVPYLAFVLFRIPLPLTVIQMLAVDLGTDLLPALALGAEPPDPALMRRPPRPRGERLLHWPLLVRAYLWLGMLEAVVAMSAFFYLLRGAGWHYGEAFGKTDAVYLQATTACLAAIVVAQVFNLFLCRHPQRSFLRTGVGGNRLLILGIAAELAIIALIVYTPLGNRLFGTAPLAGEVWLFALALAAAMGLLEEARKMLVRRGAAPAS